MPKLFHTVPEGEIPSLESGTHLYAYRRRLLTVYTHHAVVIRLLDLPEQLHGKVSLCIGWTGTEPDCRSITPDDVAANTVLVVEQNVKGVQLATIEAFRRGHRARRFYYGVPAAEFALKRAGTCSVLPLLEKRLIFDNAAAALHNPQGWEQYKLLSANCEHFAMSICTQAEFSAQILAASLVIRDIFGGAASVGSQLSTLLFKIPQVAAFFLKMLRVAPKLAGPLAAVVGALAQLAAGGVEAFVHTVRYVNYLVHKKKIRKAVNDEERLKAQKALAKSLKKGWSVNSFQYGGCLVEALIPAAVAALAGLGIVTLGVITGGPGAVVLLLAIVICPLLYLVTTKVVRCIYTMTFLTVEGEQVRMAELLECSIAPPEVPDAQPEQQQQADTENSDDEEESLSFFF